MCVCVVFDKTSINTSATSGPTLVMLLSQSKVLFWFLLSLLATSQRQTCTKVKVVDSRRVSCYKMVLSQSGRNFLNRSINYPHLSA